MRSRLAMSAAIALAGALLGVILWGQIRDIGWREYRGAAETMMNMQVINTAEPPAPLKGPDPELEKICNSLQSATGLGPSEIGFAPALLAGGITRIDYDALRRQWNDLGLFGRLRVALFGLSRGDNAAIQAATTTNRPLLRVRAKLETAFESCKWQLQLSSPLRQRAHR
jgi:hypothetical protein